LRLGGFVLSSIQEHRNLQSIKQKGVYRILCLGESTTRDQYPSYLEEILNQRDRGVRFSLIDKGGAGVNTAVILSQVGSYLDEYHPDMVVTMMGINDGGGHIPFEAPTTSKGMLFIRSFRTYKLARLLWLHILTKAKETGFYKTNNDKEHSEKVQTYLPGGELKEALAGSVPAEDSLKKALELNPKNDNAYVELGWSYRDQGKFSQAEDSFTKAIELNPKNDNAYVGLERLYRDQGKYSQAEDLFKKLIELNPKNDNAYVELERLYRDQGKYSQAEDSFKKAIELNPKNDNAYVELGWSYHDQGKLPQAEDSFTKAIELNPKNDNAYVELGLIYRDQGQLPQAEDFFKKAIELNPKNYNAYIELGLMYQTQGKYSQAEGLFKKLIELNPKNDNAYVELGLIYRDQGQLPQAEDLFKKLIELNPKNDYAYVELKRLYRDQGKFFQAEGSFKKAIELNPKSNNIYKAILILYEKMGKPKLAKECAKKVNKMKLEYYAPVTVNNYRKLKEILDRKGIKLVCVQYPMRDVEPLKQIFGKEEGIIFVDNESVFKEALKKASYKEYFVDMFGGDFGHCTQKGNRLLAENIADVILKEVFNKQ